MAKKVQYKPGEHVEVRAKTQSYGPKVPGDRHKWIEKDEILTVAIPPDGKLPTWCEPMEAVEARKRAQGRGKADEDSEGQSESTGEGSDQTGAGE